MRNLINTVRSVGLCLITFLLAAPLAAAPPAPVDYKIRLDVLRSGCDGETCWVHARAGAVPGSPPSVVLTMQRLLLAGSDVFFALNEMRSDDLGKTWTGPVEHGQSLGRRTESDGATVVPCDFWPKWHARSGRLLGTGQTARYRNNKLIDNRKRETCYSVYDPAARSWTPWTALDMPDDPKFYSAGAGCVQRVDLPGGDILLPIYFRGSGEKFTRVSVLRCSFDGARLAMIEQGNQLAVDADRGLAEPSLARFGGRFYLTLRHDRAGYVATSQDGLHFGPVQTWRWDDGTDLGNYNTQQHWVTRADGLFLVYTRKGAGNDHVFRHRAPLFIAQVDPEKLCVIRATERILVPERGARLGNFGVTDVSDRETWVTVTEWMQTWGPKVIIPIDNPRGANNSVYAARILWEKPNREWDQH